MKSTLIFPAGTTEAIRFAAEQLHRNGIPLIDHPSPEITHLLLDVPSFGAEGNLRDGRKLSALLERLPENVTVIGGNLIHPDLAGYQTFDLLQKEDYLCPNAAITAECALRIAALELKTTFRDTPTLVIGWGRIGKCLAQLLQAMGAPVSVAARKEKDRAMLCALGFNAIGMDDSIGKYRLILNTVPEAVFADEIIKCTDCVKIDLASRKGLAGDDVICARGLPGKLAPESSGQLIADTILRYIREESL